MAEKLIILTAVGPKDRPGIIASLTLAVLQAGGNLDDATMTRLHGAFATMIAARIDEAAIEPLNDRLDDLSRELDLHIVLDQLDGTPESSAVSANRPDHIITVYGADHPGIVHHVAALLEQHGVNITDLETRLTSESGGSVYVMMVETSGGNWSNLPHALAELGRTQAVDASFSLIDEETL